VIPSHDSAHRSAQDSAHHSAHLATVGVCTVKSAVLPHTHAGVHYEAPLSLITGFKKCTPPVHCGVHSDPINTYTVHTPKCMCRRLGSCVVGRAVGRAVGSPPLPSTAERTS
jgi:hypothetical protein